jgi:tetratricopeptide (TPR) repeat protein
MSIKSVFLSSTTRDLIQYCEAVYRAVEGLGGYRCVRLEDFARGWEADDFCRAKVAGCDLFVGVVGHLYGSCPEGSEQSYTEREYEAAIAAKMPRLMFIAPEDFPLPMQLREPDEKWHKQRAFRERVNRERIRDTFTSPEDLARQVVQAIRNLEQEQAAWAEGVMPRPPQPYIAHPYPAQAHFTGRERERADLTAWLADDAHPLLAVIAIGGMGKSALGWHWFHNDLWPLGFGHWDFRGALWWCFYDRESGFERFLERAIAYVSGGEMDAANWPVRDRMECLRALLAERRFLLMLDGAERLLRAYARMDAPYLGDAEVGAQRGGHRASPHQCADPNVGTFLQWLAGLGATKTLLTSRLLPRELEGLAGVARMDLTQMEPEDAVRFFQALSIQGTRAELAEACAPYGHLPLALRLLAGLVAEDPARPGDISVATEYELTEDLGGKEQHHILERAYDALDPAARELLSRIAAFRWPVDYGLLEAIFASAVQAPQPKGFLARLFTRARKHAAFLDKSRLKETLQSLRRRGLLSHQEGTGRYDLHPVVRRYAYDRLADKEGTHARLRDYFATVPKPERVKNLDDLAPTVELYHHTVRAGRYDEGVRLLRDRLMPNPLYFRLGAYQLIVELLRALFPGGELFTPSGKAAPSHLSEEVVQGWTLNALANSYSLSGQSGQAVPLFEGYIAISKRRGDKTNEALGLGNLADDQLKIGALAAAEQSLRRRIVLCREIGDEFLMAIGHQELGRLLAYRGQFGESERELAVGLELFLKVGSTKDWVAKTWAYRALRALFVGDSGSALECAMKALEFSTRDAQEDAPVERDFIVDHWLLGAAHRARGELAQAGPHLAEALRRCRCINLIELEPNILLELARLRQAQAALPTPAMQRAGEPALSEACPEPRRRVEGGSGVGAEVLSLAQEALDIAERCEYRLVQADCHNFLAELALALSEAGPEPRRRVEGLEAGNLEEARRHAETARDLAWCDGPPHRYEAAFQEAERLLEEIGSLKH